MGILGWIVVGILALARPAQAASICVDMPDTVLTEKLNQVCGWGNEFWWPGHHCESDANGGHKTLYEKAQWVNQGIVKSAVDKFIWSFPGSTARNLDDLQGRLVTYLDQRPADWPRREPQRCRQVEPDTDWTLCLECGTERLACVAKEER